MKRAGAEGDQKVNRKMQNYISKCKIEEATQGVAAILMDPTHR